MMDICVCMKQKIDKKDMKIIGVLKSDSRASIREISRVTGIRPSTVHKRLNEMKGDGTIERFTVKLSNAAIGEDFPELQRVSTQPWPFGHCGARTKHG